MHTIKQIIDNQSNHRKLILQWFTKDLKESKKKLFEIESNDEFVNSQIYKLKNRFKKTLYKKEIDKLFFLHPKRNKNLYAWWNVEDEEVIILNYGKK